MRSDLTLVLDVSIGRRHFLVHLFFNKSFATHATFGTEHRHFISRDELVSNVVCTWSPAHPNPRLKVDTFRNSGYITAK